MIPLTLEEDRELQQELNPGESVRWVGRPNPSVIFHSADSFAIPFSLMWSAFSIFWECSAVKDGNIFFDLWGVPFIVVGQYLLWGRFIHARWKKRQLIYVLTERRAFTLVMSRTRKVISSQLDAVSGLEKEIRSDGIGTINIGAGDLRYGRRGGHTTPDDLYLSRGFPVFVDIDNANEVFSLLTNLQSRIRERPVPAS